MVYVLTFVDAFWITVNFNKRCHGNFKHFIRISGLCNLTFSSSVTDLTVAALNAFAFVDANIDSATELDVCRVWEFECTEFRRQKVSINSIEVFKQVRINRATAKGNKKRQQQQHKLNESNQKAVNDERTHPLKIIVSSWDLVSVTCI